LTNLLARSSAIRTIIDVTQGAPTRRDRSEILKNAS